MLAENPDAVSSPPPASGAELPVGSFGVQPLSRALLRVTHAGTVRVRAGSLRASQDSGPVLSTADLRTGALADAAADFVTVAGTGTALLAHQPGDINLIDLPPGGRLCVNQAFIVAFEAAISYGAVHVQGAGTVSGGGMSLYSFKGPGRIAITTDADPVTLAVDGTVRVDQHTAICWNTSLGIGYQRIDPGGAAAMGCSCAVTGRVMTLTGVGFVMVQPSRTARGGADPSPASGS